MCAAVIPLTDVHTTTLRCTRVVFVLECITKKLDSNLGIVLEYFKCNWLPIIVQNVLNVNVSFISFASVIKKTIFIDQTILVGEENHI